MFAESFASDLGPQAFHQDLDQSMKLFWGGIWSMWYQLKHAEQQGGFRALKESFRRSPAGKISQNVAKKNWEALLENTQYSS